MSDQFNLVKQLSDMQNKHIDKQFKFDLSKRPKKSNKSKPKK